MPTERLVNWAQEGGRATTAVVGSGFVGRALVRHLARTPGIAPPLVVNRTPQRAVDALARTGWSETEILVSDDPQALDEALGADRPAVTRDPGVLSALEQVDVVIEATGALEYGLEVTLGALRSGHHVVSYNMELDALVGHLLEREAERHQVVYTVADGDQPGVLLRVIREVESYGLRVAGAMNCKRNLDVHQSPEQSRAYAQRDGTSIHMTTSFGDGTKMHVENVVVANLSGLTPRPLGTEGVRTTVGEVASEVADLDWPDGWVHYTLGGDFGGGVLVLARAEDAFDAGYLKYGKLGDGPLYPFFRPYHLIHLEVPSTLLQVLLDGRGLGRRTDTPVAECVALAKTDLRAGERLDGIGGAACYGVAAPVAATEALLPIGLSEHATLRRDVAQDTPIRLEDVDREPAPLVRARAEQDALVRG